MADNSNWRGGGGEPYAAPGTSTRGRNIILLLAALLALVGVLVAWIIFVKPPSSAFFLALPIREYTARVFPPNAYAYQDADALMAHFAEDRRKKAHESQTRDRLILELANLRGRTDGPVVVFLSALARTHQDEVVLFPVDADPDQSATWLPFKEVWQAIVNCPAAEKLLILDIARPMADARLGILSEDTAERLQVFLDEQIPKNPPVLVLSACGPAQASYTAETLGRSVFGYYLDLGLKGHADGFNKDGARDQRVSARELAAFVRARVERWAWHNLEKPQTPHLMGPAGTDFALVGVDQETIPETPPAATAPPYPVWLKKGWEVQDQWRQQEYFRLAPRIHRQMEAALLRAEKRWRAGFEKGRPEGELEVELARFDKLGKQARDLPQRRPRALAQLQDPALAKKLEPLAEPLRVLLLKAQDPPAKKEDVDKARLEFLEKAKDIPFTALASTVFGAVAKLPLPSAGQIVLVEELLQSLKPDGDYVETMTLKRLSEFVAKVKDREWEWPAPLVYPLLRVAREQERAVAALAKEPALLPWVAEVFNQADTKRREGEKILFEGRPTVWPGAASPLQQAEQQYKTILARLESLQQACRDWDEAMVFLPALAPLLHNLPDWEPPLEDLWNGAVLATHKLGDTLAKPAPEALALLDIPSHSELRRNLRLLRESLRNKRERITQADPSPELLHDFLALMETPLLDASQRENLWHAGSKLAAKLHDKVSKLDLADDQNQVSTAGSISREDPRGLQTLRGVRRARLALDVFRLVDFPDIHKLQDESVKVLSSKQPTSLHDLGKKLHETWAAKLPDRYRKLAGNLEKLDLLSRIWPPFDPLPGERDLPTTALKAQHTIAYFRWLGTRYQAEAQGLDNTALSVFYQQAAAYFLP